MAVQVVPQTSRLDGEQIETLRTSVRGNVLLPGEAGYDDARAVWNGMHDKHPALIVQPSGVADVITAVNFAREHDLLLAIKGGGHNVAGNALCDDGLLLDLSSMRSVQVDPAAQTAYVEGGALWGDFDHETAAFNLTTTGGVVSTTGVAGLTLGGGIGWLNPKFGASCDNVLAYDVVLADGRFVRASADEHTDLFWALKGGGGNFGVVTGFLFKLHPFNHQVLAGGRFFQMDQTRDLLGFYRDFIQSTSRDVVVYCAMWINPATESNACAIAFCHSGESDAAEQEMAPVRGYGDADLDIIGPYSYTDWQQAFDPLLPHGRGYYWKALLFTELTDEILDIAARHGPAKPNAISYSVFEQFGGAYGDVGITDTAFRHRDIRHQIVIGGAWDDPAEQDACIRWVREYHDALAPHAATARNLNFTVVEDDEKSDRVAASYGENYDRLARVKGMYDPGNLFRVNNNIKPVV
jgi:FAD/FMN-containing dehydrogenase